MVHLILGHATTAGPRLYQWHCSAIAMHMWLTVGFQHTLGHLCLEGSLLVLSVLDPSLAIRPLGDCEGHMMDSVDCSSLVWLRDFAQIELRIWCKASMVPLHALLLC